MLARVDGDPIEPVTVKLRNGSWVKVQERRARDGDLVCLAIDITEQMRIWAAIDVLPDGFVLFDREERLLACNQRYRDMFPDSAPAMQPGVSFEELLRHGLKHSHVPDAVGREEDWLADAFMSKTDAIPLEKVQAMAKRLINLEDYLSDQDVGDLPLDTDSLLMIGIDAANIEVIGDGGNEPTEAMRTWASALQPGSWFNLDHNGKVSHVQFAWCSERKQLHLFVAADGRSFLIQMRRLAAYLQAGLLVPTEEEALTVRATREALAKLDANPERLLSQD